jgi:hypothetical protein
MGGWGETGTKVLSVLNGVDLHAFLPRPVRPEMVCDASMVGGKWPYKSQNIDRFIFPLLQAGKPYSVRLYGNSEWGVPQYLGSISQEDEAALYSSVRVCLNVHEPHSTDLGYDLIERPLKTAACGGVVLSDYVEGWNEVLGENVFWMEKNPTGLRGPVEVPPRQPLVRQGEGEGNPASHHHGPLLPREGHPVRRGLGARPPRAPHPRQKGGTD